MGNLLISNFVDMQGKLEVSAAFVVQDVCVRLYPCGGKFSLIFVHAFFNFYCALFFHWLHQYGVCIIMVVFKHTIVTGDNGRRDLSVRS